MLNAVYDSELIKALSNRLYAQSRVVILKYTLFGAALFALNFYYAASIGHNPLEFLGLAPIKAIGGGMLIGIVAGFSIGRKQSYLLKLQAQLALCQLQIEKTHIQPEITQSVIVIYRQRGVVAKAFCLVNTGCLCFICQT